MSPVLLILLAGFAHAGSDAMYERAVSLVRHRYIDLDGFDAADAFDEAAEAAEDVVPWLLVDADGGVATLRHGQQGTMAIVSLDEGPEGRSGLDALPGALSRLEAAIRSSPAGVPETVDLPVALLRGVSRELDRHSVVLSRGRLERFDERIKGKLTGIGARMGRRDGRLVIKEVFADGPADHAGLAEGDRIARVDGVSMLGMSTSVAIDRVRGPANTQVVLDVERPVPSGGFEALEIVLTRAEVVIPTVHVQLLPSGVGVIRIDNFSEQTARLVRAGLERFQGAESPLRGLVLDLRGNTGGSLLQACKVADLFVEEGTVVRTEGRDGKPVENLLRHYRAHPEGVEPGVPMVILIDHRSASASEIVAGSLSLLGRAALVGQGSHGKGTVQKLYTLRGGDAEERVRFKLTVARYRLPEDVIIETGVGLRPDLDVAEARFTRGGVMLPAPSGEARVLWVDEQPGWREGVELPDTPDFPLELAEESLLSAVASDRGALLTALEGTARRRAIVEDARLVEVFGHRGIDWRPAAESGPPPAVDVELSIVDPPVPGSDVEVRAVVHNRGARPLARLAVQLTTESALPWSELTLPVGFLPPGEAAMGSAMVHVGAGLSEREDVVGVTILADGREAVAAADAVLHVAPATPAPVSVTARAVPGPKEDRLELLLTNHGGRHLDHLRVRVMLPADAPIELLDPEGVVPLLPAGGTERVDLGIARIAPGPVELELRVEDRAGRRVFRQPFVVGDDGTPTEVSPPVVTVRAPRSAPVGQAEVDVRATDDGPLRSITVWVAGDKVAWVPVERARARVTIPVDVPSGTNAVTVDVEDASGARTREVVYIRATDPGMAGGD